jgi:hypothetical protein
VTGGPERRRRGPLRRLRELGSSGRLTIAANAAAVVTWLALGMVAMVFALGDEIEEGGIESIGAAFAMMGLLPVTVGVVVAACIATAAAVPLGIAWCRGREQPVVPGLSFAHLLVAWGMAVTFVGYRILW